MTLEQFKKEKIEAMKQKDKDKVSALNVIITKIMALTIERRASGLEVTEGDVDSLLQKAEKELTEEREGFIKAGREENVVSLTNQIEVIKKYLPKLLSEDEIKEIISTLEDRSMPSIMKHFKQNYQGKVDMRVVSALAKAQN
ncbi:MAG: GatB/YqeY domain-containing protein [Clostridia bacterium]|nr:GatB/YqeY domain-containing protein [Clostridia bacterium]